MIGNDVTVVILGFKGRQVRVGISAPKNIDIYREEILPRRVSSAPNDARAALPEDLLAPPAQSQVRWQAYRQQQPESAGSLDHETINPPVAAAAKTFGER